MTGNPIDPKPGGPLRASNLHDRAADDWLTRITPALEQTAADAQRHMDANDREKLRDALAAAEARAEVAEVALGLRRMCLNCGKTRRADEPKDDLPECQHPDYPGLAACTWDATPQEAWEHWRKVAHDQRAEVAALRAELASGSFYKEADIDALMDERDALRAKLEDVLPLAESYLYIMPDRRGTAVATLEAARALLDAPKGEGE